MTLSRAIRLMILGGLFVIGVVIARACQAPDSAMDRFATGSLRALTSLEAPPVQPNLSFATPEGSVTLEDYRGKVILVNAWATWCPPCVVEMPSLDELQRLRGGDDFVVLPISLDRSIAEIEQFYSENTLTHLPILHDGNYSINARLELPGLPTTILYDRFGREVARLSGEANWASDEALALVDHLIEQPGPSGASIDEGS